MEKLLTVEEAHNDPIERERIKKNNDEFRKPSQHTAQPNDSQSTHKQ